MSDERLRVNECFCSPQGEGVRTGTINHFVRLSGCNQRCAGTEVDGAWQPLCDTEFESGRFMTVGEVCDLLREINDRCRWIIFTGGEPGLQLTPGIVGAFRLAGYRMAIETNGTIDATKLGLDWITVSPKVAEHNIKCLKADEVKYVRGYGQAVPKTVVEAEHKLISPAFEGGLLDQRTLQWCIRLCKENPEWRLSQQLHHQWKVR